MTTLPLDLPARRCGVEGCRAKHLARGMCKRHYKAATTIPHPKPDRSARFAARVNTSGPRVVAGGYSEDVMAVLSEGWERAKASDRRVLHGQWHSLRDNPEALRAAILAALETK